MLLHIKHNMGPKCMDCRTRALETELCKLQLCGSAGVGGEISVIEVRGELSEASREALIAALSTAGMTLLPEGRPNLAEEVRLLLDTYVDSLNEQTRTSVRDELIAVLPYSYEHLARVFSQEMKCTIEHYVIQRKTERVKVLLIAGLSLTEIAYRLQYSSVAHLSAQFKKIAGYTPTVFKLQRIKAGAAMRASTALCCVICVAYDAIAVVQSMLSDSQIAIATL